jgi:hypothetical protein
VFEEELANVSVQPPRSGVLPGMRIAAVIPRSALLLLVLLVLFFGTFPLMIASTDPHMKLVIGPSRPAEARVLEVRETGSCRDTHARQVVFAFAAQSGGEFRGSALVCEQSPYYNAQPGDRIEIHYLAREPAVNAIAGNGPAAPPLFVFAFFPVFMLLVLLPTFVPQLRGVLRARRIYRNGSLVQGTVVFVKRRAAWSRPGWPGSSAAEVYVAHQSPSGGRAETVVWCPNDWLINQLAPGTSVHILLPPEKSKQGVLLEAFIR